MARTALVTGATDGIGLATARGLLRGGWRVIVHGRTTERVAPVVEELRAAAGEAVTGDAADLSSMDAVVELGSRIRERHPLLDVLLHNAGVYETRRMETADGFERTIAINHLAPFLLTRHLLPALTAAPAGRIVTVSSIAHTTAQIDPDDLSLARGYSGYRAYAASKLANILFTTALARRLEGTRCTANALHPGVISTKLLRKGFDMGGDTVENGARTSLYLCTSAEVEGISGRYFDDCREAEPSSRARDPQLAERLWAATERLLQRWL